MSPRFTAYLKKTVLNRRYLYCNILPSAAALAAWLLIPRLDTWFLLSGFIAGLQAASWTWRFREDWRRLTRYGMLVADRTIASGYLDSEARYAVIAVDRFFPRKLWVLVYSRYGAMHMYQGISFRRKVFPAKMLKSHFKRRIALLERLAFLG